MSKVDESGRHRVISVMETVLEIGFDGCSREEIADHLGMMYHSVRRALIALEAAGWVEQVAKPGSNQKLFMPGSRILKVAHKYEEHTLQKLNKLKREYREMSGKELI